MFSHYHFHVKQLSFKEVKKPAIFDSLIRSTCQEENMIRTKESKLADPFTGNAREETERKIPPKKKKKYSSCSIKAMQTATFEV